MIPTSDKPKSKSAVRDEPRFLYDCMPCLFRQLLLTVQDVEALGGNFGEATALEVEDGLSMRNEERGERMALTLYQIGAYDPRDLN